MTPAAVAGALLDLIAAWGSGVTFGVGAAMGVGVVILVVRAWGPE